MERTSEEDGEAVTLTAIIGLQGQERNESWDILVFPEISDEKRQVEDMVEKANADTEKGSEWMQPETLHGEKLVWKSRRWHAVRSSPAGIRPLVMYFCIGSRKKKSIKRKNSNRCAVDAP